MLGSVRPQAHSRCFPPEFSTYLSDLISAVANLSSSRRNVGLQQCVKTTVTSKHPPNVLQTNQFSLGRCVSRVTFSSGQEAVGADFRRGRDGAEHSCEHDELQRSHHGPIITETAKISAEAAEIPTSSAQRCERGWEGSSVAVYKKNTHISQARSHTLACLESLISYMSGRQATLNRLLHSSGFFFNYIEFIM